MWRRRPLRQNVCQCRRGAVVDEGQPSAGKSVKKRGLVVLVGPSSAPDTNHIGMHRNRWCVDVLPVSSVRDLSVYIDSDVPLSRRHSSVLPRWQYIPGSWRRGPPSPTLVSHSNSDCPACQAINPRRPIILCRRSTGMEQYAVRRRPTGCIVAHHLPTRTENMSLLLEFSWPLVANSLFPPMLYAV